MHEVVNDIRVAVIGQWSETHLGHYINPNGIIPLHFSDTNREGLLEIEIYDFFRLEEFFIKPRF